MKPVMLRAQFATAFAAEAAKWNVLFPRGTWHGANLKPIGGSIDLDSGLLEEMVANWQAAGKPKLPVRKTHRHLDDDVPAVDRPALERAFGWLTDLRVTAQGLEALTEWTPEGRTEVEGGAFAFWSPEWQPRHVDRRTGEVKGWWLSGTALTNDPFFNEMPPVAAAVLPTDPPAALENPMNEEQLKQLRASLGLAADASVEVVLAAASKLGADVKALKASVEKQPTLTAAVQEAVKAAVEPLNAQLKAADSKLLELELAGLITTAKRGDGKLGRAIVDEKVKPVLSKLVATESSREEGLKVAAAYLEAIPCTVPMQASGYGTRDEGKLTASAANEKLTRIADELRAKGVPNSMEQALLANPELAKAARALTLAVNQEN